jgi:hypothetical protein
MVSIDDVRRAFAATGLKPRRARFRPRDGSCCALGAIIQQKQAAHIYLTGEAITFLGLDPAYAWSFVAGWDGDNPLDSYSDIQQKAWLDGALAWEAMSDPDCTV